MRPILALLAISLFTSTISLARSKAAQPRTMTFIATAHSQKGQTASGMTSHIGTVAADPAVLPLGSRIHVTDAGRYTGEYTVADTGAMIKGRRIDIYMPTRAEAKKFGKQRVRVQIRQRGRGRNQDQQLTACGEISSLKSCSFRTHLP
jgi:3D (Asp-Asp-Asp) domain-containing protein